MPGVVGSETYLTVDPRSLGVFRVFVFRYGAVVGLVRRGYRGFGFWYPEQRLLCPKPHAALAGRPDQQHVLVFFHRPSSAREAKLGVWLLRVGKRCSSLATARVGPGHDAAGPR